MSKTGSLLSSLTVIGVMGLASAGCEKTDTLRELDYRYPVVVDPAYVEANFCTQKADVIRTRTKYLIVMDKSGSNSMNYQLNPDGSIALPFNPTVALATDPDGRRRYQQLLQFLSNSPASDPDRFYGLINFSTNAGVVRSFTSDRVSFQNTVQSQFNNLSDNGATNYLGALDTISNLLKADIDSARSVARGDPARAVSSSYIIIFISDGLPVVSLDPSVSPPAVTAQDPAKVVQRVRDLLTLQVDNADFVDSINVFTGYYFVTGNEDPNARALLADMAKAGRGVSYPFGGTDVIDFGLFQVPQKKIKYGLADVFVSNRNVAWSGASLLLDTDADGLPDQLEQSLGSNPRRADSDGNGVSDLVEYLVNSQRPCQDAACSAAGAKVYVTTDPNVGVCSSLTNWRTVNGAIVVPDSDKDGLNDCEEIVLGNIAGINSFDSNGDLVPDGLSVFRGLEFKAGTNSALSNPTQDGMTNYNKVKFGAPIQIPLYQLQLFKPLEYDLRVVSATEVQDCYSLRINNMPIVGPNNIIRVEVVETTSEVVNRRNYRVAEKPYAGDSKILVINEPPTEAAGVWK